MDHPDLKYGLLAAFDRAMLTLAAQYRFMRAAWAHKIYEHDEHKVLAFERGGLVFVFNFDPVRSRPDYRLPATAGKYRLILNTDDPVFGGHGRLVTGEVHFTLAGDVPEEAQSNPALQLYLPSRTAVVLFKED